MSSTNSATSWHVKEMFPQQLYQRFHNFNQMLGAIFLLFLVQKGGGARSHRFLTEIADVQIPTGGLVWGSAPTINTT